MSHPPFAPSPIPQTNHEPLTALQRAAFIVRLRRGPTDETWRCHLIHVETGQHLPCDQLDKVGQRMEQWLQQARQGTGLR